MCISALGAIPCGRNSTTTYVDKSIEWYSNLIHLQWYLSFYLLIWIISYLFTHLSCPKNLLWPKNSCPHLSSGSYLYNLSIRIFFFINPSTYLSVISTWLVRPFEWARPQCCPQSLLASSVCAYPRDLNKNEYFGLFSRHKGPFKDYIPNQEGG